MYLKKVVHKKGGLWYNVFISEDKPQAQAEVRNTDTRTLSEPKPEAQGEVGESGIIKITT